MKKSLLCLCLLGLSVLKANTQGIVFSGQKSWDEILETARIEKKYIFIDCYATWCKPCRMMDKQVYSNDTVGRIVNENFISIRIQMDTLVQDSREIVGWRKTARSIERQYQVNGYPCYLFFSPNGTVVHKEFGYKSVAEFKAVIMRAMDTNFQYFTLLRTYEKGEKKFEDMRTLAATARRFGDDSLSRRIGIDYMENYLSALPCKSLWTRNNIEFITDFGTELDSDATLFGRYYNEKRLVDSAMKDAYFSDALIDMIVYREQVKKFVRTAMTNKIEPDWNKIKNLIEKKYDLVTAERNVIKGEVEYYRGSKDWPKYATCLIREMELIGADKWNASVKKSMTLNNGAYEVFLHSIKKKELRIALNWAETALSMEMPRPTAQSLDTKANLLYKLGKRRRGMELEERSNAMDPSDKEIAASYEKMKNGLPTWPQE